MLQSYRSHDQTDRRRRGAGARSGTTVVMWVISKVYKIGLCAVPHGLYVIRSTPNVHKSNFSSYSVTETYPGAGWRNQTAGDITVTV